IAPSPKPARIGPSPMIRCGFELPLAGHRPPIERWWAASPYGDSHSLPLEELLGPAADDVARVDVPPGVEREAVDPVELAGLFMAVGPLRNGPELEQLARRVELHEHLVAGRAAQGLVGLAPGHRRRAAHPDLVVLRDPEPPRHEEVAPDVEELALLVEH